MADFPRVRETVASSMSVAFRAFMPPLERAGYVRHWCSPDRFARELGDLRQHHVVAERDGSVIGIASAEWRDGYAELWRLYVHPDAWRLGVGRRLWEHIAAGARAQGLGRIRLDSFADAAGSQRFYQAMGCAPGRLWSAILFDGSRLKVRLREHVARL
jgi:GNAT superfamily N-acetyltransferase